MLQLDQLFPLNTMMVHTFLELSAKRFPDKIAVIQGNNRLDYCQLNNAANQVANHLKSVGVLPGERIILLLENSIEYVISYYAVLKAGCVVVPLNPELKSNELTPLLTRISPTVLIVSSRGERALTQCDLSLFSITSILLVQPNVTQCSKYCTLPVISLAEIITSDNCDNPPSLSDDHDLASIIFTSGSTGVPKGVMLSHRNITTNTASIIHYLHLSSHDIQMVVIPFFYVMGGSLLNTHISAGGTLVINNMFAFPTTVLQQMVDENVTGFSGVPSTYTYLLHRSPLKLYRDKLSSLRYCTQAGGHLASHHKQELLDALPEHTKLYIMYGATEAAARLSYVEPERLKSKLDSIGIPIPGVTLRIVDNTGNEIHNGSVGELVASGPNIMLGYWEDPQGTASVINHLGYFTGDLGYRDEDGYYYLTGRKDNMLKVGGHKISPQEIEDALIATDLVIEAVVVGVADSLLGHTLKALAVPRDGSITCNLILAAMLKLLPRHKIPATLELVSNLPKNSNGKTDRTACLALVL